MVPFGSMLLLVGMATATPLSACARPFDTEELTQAIDAAEAAFREQDATTFTEEEVAVVERLNCVRDPLTADVIGRVHRVHALGAFLRKEDTKRDAALGGVLDTDPEAVLPPDLVPGGHPVRLAFEAILESGDDGGHRALVAVSSGWFEVDGKAISVAPVRHDAVVQRIDGDGKVVETRFLPAGASLEDWKGSDAPIVATISTPLPKPKAKVKWQRVGFGIGTGVTLLGAGALYAVASSAKSNALDLETPLDQAEEDKNVANASTWGWIGSAAAAAGLGAALVITW